MFALHIVYKETEENYFNCSQNSRLYFPAFYGSNDVTRGSGGLSSASSEREVTHNEQMSGNRQVHVHHHLILETCEDQLEAGAIFGNIDFKGWS